MILSDVEIAYLTGLSGYRIVNHQLRKRLIIDLVRRHFRPGDVLGDIGCAAGDTTMELQALGYQMSGVDFEPQRMARAREVACKHGLNVRFLNEDLRRVEHSECFDGMIMGEVLEHFTEPRAILEQHLTLIRPGGKVVLTVPNVASLRARLKLLCFGEFADHNPEHRYYFTRRRLVEHLQGAPIEFLEIFSFLVEFTLFNSESWARFERFALAPVKWAVPWCGTHLVAILRKSRPV